jgi:DNA-binding NarL/FixJ family response regulator
MKKIRVAVFDDSLFFRESIHLLFEDRNDFLLAGSYTDANNVMDDIRASNPDVVLMDIDMPLTNGIDALRIIKKEIPDLPVMMLTSFDDDDKIIESICAGANGYTLKTTQSEKIITGINDVYNGHSSLCPPIAKKVLKLFSNLYSETEEVKDYLLSPREMDVLRELVNGCQYKVVANKLGITYDTVRAHVKQIYRKMQVESISGAVSKALKEHIVS